MTYEEKIEKLREIIAGSDNIVFFGGAGVSTESGIPDFRSEDGLYRQKYKYPPEFMLSHTCYATMPEEFFRYYKDKLLVTGIKPNKAHYKLAQWEKEGKLKAVITQNIDGLHQKAGSKKVYELHGSVARNYCEKCHKFHDLEYIMDESNCRNLVPYCECGGRIKPDVVLYEEALDSDVISGAVAAISKADVLIIGGTSLAVYPAAGFIHYFRGDKLVLINKTPTGLDANADLVIYDSIGKVMKMD